MAREIKMSELKALVEQGKKKEFLMEHYGLNSAQVTKLMKEAKLTFRKFRRPSFTLVDDLNVIEEPISSEDAVLTDTPETEETAPVEETEENLFSDSQSDANPINWAL